jgi:hypothetical protein
MLSIGEDESRALLVIIETEQSLQNSLQIKLVTKKSNKRDLKPIKVARLEIEIEKS